MAPPSSSSKSRDERGALYGRITGTNGQSKEFTLDAEYVLIKTRVWGLHFYKYIVFSIIG